MKRSHRHPETDGLPASPGSTVPVELPRQPWPGSVEYDCRCVSELNVSHYSVFGRRRRSKEQRRLTLAALEPFELPPGPWEVLVHRIGWAVMDPHDSARIAVKSCVDAVAEWLGIDDRDPRVTWLYSQEVTRKRQIVRTARGQVSCSVNRVRIAIRTRKEP